MKNHWLTSSITLLIIGGIGIPLAYFQGQRSNSSKNEAPYRALAQVEESFELLQLVKDNRVADVVHRHEVRLWNAILPLHTHRAELISSGIDPAELDNILREAAMQFRDHPIITKGIISEKDALTRNINAAPAQDYSNSNTTHTVKLVQADLNKKLHARHSETRDIVLKYLKKQAPQDP